MKNLILTEKEYAILKDHWNRNLSYGEGGTFGDGNTLVNDEGEKSVADYRVAQKIAKKLK